ncbi:hypothetical protein [Spongiimicrobium salis]|uniref:hypothetical protein n=1 Tax=Spongiimicrobium salis TaxID=1667022 RepID=UPI00374DACF5
MKHKHLSDQDIQEFTFDLSQCSPEVIQHLSVCEICKMRSEHYSSVSEALENLPDPILDYNLADEVVKQLERSSKKETAHHYFIYFIIALGGALIISCLFYFKEIFIEVFKSNSAPLTSLIIGIVLLISVGAILDMLRSYHQKIKMLNYE